MMEYWRGHMNWAVDRDWMCEICGDPEKRDKLWTPGMTWGMIHAECRCNRCHAVYRMRDKDGVMITRPKLMIKEAYVDPFKKMWTERHLPFDEVADDLEKEVQG